MLEKVGSESSRHRASKGGAARTPALLNHGIIITIKLLLAKDSQQLSKGQGLNIKQTRIAISVNLVCCQVFVAQLFSKLLILAKICEIFISIYQLSK